MPNFELNEPGMYILGTSGEIKKIPILTSEESFGKETEDYFIGVRLSQRELNRDLDWNAGYKSMNVLKKEIQTTSYLLDKKDVAEGEQERKELIALFPSHIFVEEIPNEYSDEPWTVNRKWLAVTTSKGRIKIGWRKRVINIEYSHIIKARKAMELFPDEDTTRYDFVIHAWSLEKAKEYIQKILNQ